MEKKIKLTKAQKRVMDEVKSYPGGHLRLFRRNKGTVLCFKLMDKDLNPIKYLSHSMIKKLMDRDLIKKVDEIYKTVEQ
jgi:hypothetical protein